NQQQQQLLAAALQQQPAASRPLQPLQNNLMQTSQQENNVMQPTQQNNVIQPLVGLQQPLMPGGSASATSPTASSFNNNNVGGNNGQNAGGQNKPGKDSIMSLFNTPPPMTTQMQATHDPGQPVILMMQPQYQAVAAPNMGGGGYMAYTGAPNVMNASNIPRQPLPMPVQMGQQMVPQQQPNTAQSTPLGVFHNNNSFAKQNSQQQQQVNANGAGGRQTNPFF
ncbi:hypothetical protein BC829DRAFT_407106, partial [Chytridium lagenaria]